MDTQDTMTPPRCPECGANWKNVSSCQDFFHQLLYWEAENPVNGTVHHLMVLSYYIQHPSLYSMNGLKWGVKLLKEFVKKEVSPGQARQRMHIGVDSGNRKWKIRGTDDSYGGYNNPVQWELTIEDVIRRSEAVYRQSVQSWAESILDSLKTSDNL